MVQQCKLHNQQLMVARASEQDSAHDLDCKLPRGLNA
uniref:Uncharacterized protein n=1 Tax=Arundo donax TaxID=35708 RepID=A0A0A9CEY2_ARUDO